MGFRTAGSRAGSAAERSQARIDGLALKTGIRACGAGRLTRHRLGRALEVKRWRLTGGFAGQAPEEKAAEAPCSLHVEHGS